MPDPSLKSHLKDALTRGERLSALHPRAYPLDGWWEADSLECSSPLGWPLPIGAAVIESKTGYRFGPENLTLAWALRGQRARSIIDLGAGSGSLGLIGMYTTASPQLIAVERQTSQVDRLRRTLGAFRKANALTGTVDLLQVDIRAPSFTPQARAMTPKQEGADLVLLNPPFFPKGWGRESGSEEVHASTHALFGDVCDFVQVGAKLLSPHGRLCILYDASRLADLLPALTLAGLSIEALKYTPDTRPHKQNQPFRVWLFASAQGAPISPLKDPNDSPKVTISESPS